MKTKITMPIKGDYTGIDKTPDDAFANKGMGDGFLITPEEGKAYAPFSGKVSVMFPTGHAVGLKNASGVEVLIHVGIDTVKLKGEGFTQHVKQGDRVKKGDVLLEFDIDYIKEQGYDPATPLVFVEKEKVEILKKETDTRDTLKLSLK